MVTILLKFQFRGGGHYSKFQYKDKFGRGGWLNMMKVRLKLVKTLLAPEGIIFCSIDDVEYAYLKVLMDEIFGENNFIKTLVWQTNNSVMKQSNDFRKDHEYVLCYSNNIDNIKIKKMFNKKLKFTNIDNDPQGPWISTNATYKTNKEHPNYFGIKVKNKIFYRTWRFSKEEFKKNNLSLFFNNENIPRIKRYKKNYNLNKKTPSTLLFLNDIPYSHEGMASFTTAKNELKKIFSDKEEKFNTPKPINLIKWLISRIFNKNAIILDFFAGSGTTGHAVLELNKEDGGNRHFILVTNNENNIAYDVAFERIFRIIKGRVYNKKNFDNIEWTKKNKPFKNVQLRVIDIDDSIKISLKENISEKIYENCKKGLYLLDGKYDKKELNLYYDLAALNPLKDRENQF